MGGMSGVLASAGPIRPHPIHSAVTGSKAGGRGGYNAHFKRSPPLLIGVCIWMHLVKGTGNGLWDGRPPE